MKNSLCHFIDIFMHINTKCGVSSFQLNLDFHSICVCASVPVYKCVSMRVCVFGHQSQKKNKNERRKTFFLFRHSSVPFVTFMLFGIIMEAHSTRPHFHNSISKCGKQIHAHTHAHVTPCPQIHIRTQTHRHTQDENGGKKKAKRKFMLFYYYHVSHSIRDVKKSQKQQNTIF